MSGTGLRARARRTQVTLLSPWCGLKLSRDARVARYRFDSRGNATRRTGGAMGSWHAVEPSKDATNTIRVALPEILIPFWTEPALLCVILSRVGAFGTEETLTSADVLAEFALFVAFIFLYGGVC